MSSVISSPPPNDSKDMARSESPKIVCTAQGCNQKFSNTSELAIHKQKHQMTLKLGPSRTGLTDMLPFQIDQTPTPTKFLQGGKETGLFDEISNPFDNEFKKGTRGESLKEKARRSAVPRLNINSQTNKARTPTSYSCTTQAGLPTVGQPVHVITLTPTLPSPIISGNVFIPPLPSPQGYLHSPALISPSIVPFSAPGLPFPTVQAVVEAQQAAIAQAFINATAVANNQNQAINSQQAPDVRVSQEHLAASRTSSVTDLPNTATAPFPTQNVSIPVNNNPTPPSCHAMPVGPNMASAPVGSASVIQQHGQVSMEQRRALTQSNSLEPQQHSMSVAGMERRPSFHGETSVITQAPAHSSTGQMNPNMNMHPANSNGYHPYLVSQPPQTVPPFSQLAADVSGRMASHPVLTASRSVPTPPHNMQNHQHQLPHQNSLPSNIDAKQKLKETLTSNNPNLHSEMPGLQPFTIKEEDPQNEVSSSSGNDNAKSGRRRGRQTDLDPDTKRMRFLERNRAAASRCRAKKKQWVSGLEVKAKELSTSNINLQNEVATLREEVASLKQLLLAHRDCPITRLQQQKLAIAGGDPSAVVSNPVQAAASLLGIARSENSDGTTDTHSVHDCDDIKPDPSNLHLPLTHTTSDDSLSDGVQVTSSMQMETSVLVNSNHCKSEEQTDAFPVVPQATSTSAIVMNDNYHGVPSSLSTSVTST